LFVAVVNSTLVRTSIKPDGWYSAREAASLLGALVTEATVKEYCKKQRVRAKKIGPRKRWMVSGASLVKLRKEWGID
jgi:hypothetical protein